MKLIDYFRRTPPLGLVGVQKSLVDYSKEVMGESWTVGKMGQLIYPLVLARVERHVVTFSRGNTIYFDDRFLQQEDLVDSVPVLVLCKEFVLANPVIPVGSGFPDCRDIRVQPCLSSMRASVNSVSILFQPRYFVKNILLQNSHCLQIVG